MSSVWVEEEFAEIDLGDRRLNARATTLLGTLGNRPNLSIPAACSGHSEMQAAYRFFDNDKVTFEKVLSPHALHTLQRIGEHPVALLVNDTSEINLTRPEQAVVGVGDLDGSSRQGLLLHAMHAFTPEGTPLGTAWAQYINRTEGVSHAPEAKKEAQRKHKPIEEKESMRWLTGLRQARAIAGQLPQVQCIYVGDSEADIYECFAEPRETGLIEEEPGAQVDWLVRACQDRALNAEDSDGLHLRERALATPVLYEVELRVRGHEPRTAVDQRERHRTRQDRRATVQVRATTMTLRPPWRPDRKLPPVTVNVVLVREPNPPPGEPVVEWMLVTTLPIDTLGQVRLVVEYYCVRWNIEMCHPYCLHCNNLYHLCGRCFGRISSAA